MNTGHHFRPATGADAEIIAAWFPTHAEALLWGGSDVPAVDTAAWIAEQYRDASRRHLVLVDASGAVCGVYSLRSVPEERRLHIGRLGVAPASRGAGLGSDMIRRAIAFAREESAEIVTLFVDKTNVAARRLYDRLGFVLADKPSDFPHTQSMQYRLGATDRRP